MWTRLALVLAGTVHAISAWGLCFCPVYTIMKEGPMTPLSNRTTFRAVLCDQPCSWGSPHQREKYKKPLIEMGFSRAAKNNEGMASGGEIGSHRWGVTIRRFQGSLPLARVCTQGRRNPETSNITKKIESHLSKDPDIWGHVLIASCTFYHIKKAETQRGAGSSVPMLQPEDLWLGCAMVQQGISSLRVHWGGRQQKY